MKNPHIAQSLRDLMNSETETKRQIITAILSYFDSINLEHDKIETAAELWEYSLNKLNSILDKILNRLEKDIQTILKQI